MKTMIFFLLFLSLNTARADSSRDCKNLDLQVSSTMHSFNSDPAPALSFKVERDKKDGCNFFVTCDNGGASSYANRRMRHTNGVDSIPVQVCLDATCSAIHKHFPEAVGNTDVLYGSFPDGTTQPDEITLYRRPRLGAIDYPKHGSYQETFTLRLYEGTIGGTYRYIEAKNFQVTYTVAKQIDLALVTAGGQFNVGATTLPLNFGELSSAAPQSFDLVLKFNAGYRVRYSSANEGNFKNTAGTDLVPYTLRINGLAVNLGSSDTFPVTITSGSGVSPAGGLRITNTITVGSTEQAMAGSYADDITVSVVSTE